MPDVKLYQKVFLAGYDLSTRHTQIAESAEIEELDATTFGSHTKIAEPGLKGYGLSGEGLWAGGDHEIDDVLFDQQRVRDLPVTIAMLGGDVGSPARSVLAMIGSYEFSGGHGELMTVSYELGAMDAPVHGRILHNAEATGVVTGEPVELGAVGTGQKIYGVLHVFAGDSALTVKIQSATDEAFTTPVSRIAFAAVATGISRAYQWATPVVAPASHTWWRATSANRKTRRFAVIAAIR